MADRQQTYAAHGPSMDIFEGRKYAYRPGDLSRGFYTIEPDEVGERFRYVWTEEALDTPAEHGRWLESPGAALRDAAGNWDDAGSGGRLASTLRAAATRIERRPTGEKEPSIDVERVRRLLSEGVRGEAKGTTIPVPVEDVRELLGELARLDAIGAAIAGLPDEPVVVPIDEPVRRNAYLVGYRNAVHDACKIARGA